MLLVCIYCTALLYNLVNHIADTHVCVWNHQWHKRVRCYEDCENYENLTSTIINECFTLRLSLTIVHTSQIQIHTRVQFPALLPQLAAFRNVLMDGIYSIV